jgi:CBS domain-containing protein
VWGTLTDIDLSGLLATVSKNTQSVQVADIMTTEVVTVPPDTHVMTILDIMIRRHIRRIPVVDGETIAGMVYLSDLFYVLVDRLEP